MFLQKGEKKLNIYTYITYFLVFSKTSKNLSVLNFEILLEDFIIKN